MSIQKSPSRNNVQEQKVIPYHKKVGVTPIEVPQQKNISNENIVTKPQKDNPRLKPIEYMGFDADTSNYPDKIDYHAAMIDNSEEVNLADDHYQVSYTYMIKVRGSEEYFSDTLEEATEIVSALLYDQIEEHKNVIKEDIEVFKKLNINIGITLE